MLKKTRRVISGINANQKSTILADEKIAALAPYPSLPSFYLQDLFYTEENPQTLATRHLDNIYDLHLPEGAMRFLKICMPTQAQIAADLQNSGQAIPTDWTKFNLHSTNSVDYIFILSGSITCIVGKNKIDLHAGDFLVQVGPEHTWINNNSEPCYALCVMVGTKERAQ